MSGRFRKVSGSLSGSLHVCYSFVAVPEGSGRFPEACPEACFSFLCIAAVPEASGRFPEACPEACLNLSIYRIPEASGRPTGRVTKHLVMVSGLISDTS